MAIKILAGDVKKIVFACEAGMGSSLIGANQLKKKLKKAKLDVSVTHSPVRSIPKDAQVVVCHKGLAKMARETASSWAVVIAFTNFMNNPIYDKLVQAIQNNVEISDIG